MNIRIDGIELTAKQVREAVAKLDAAEKRELGGGVEWPIRIKNDHGRTIRIDHHDMRIGHHDVRVSMVLDCGCRDVLSASLTNDQCDDLILALQAANMVSGAGPVRENAWTQDSWQMSRLAQIAVHHGFVRACGECNEDYISTSGDYRSVSRKLEDLPDKPWEVRR